MLLLEFLLRKHFLVDLSYLAKDASFNGVEFVAQMVLRSKNEGIVCWSFDILWIVVDNNRAIEAWFFMFDTNSDRFIPYVGSLSKSDKNQKWNEQKISYHSNNLIS